MPYIYAKPSVLSIGYRTSTIYHELRQPHLEWWLVLRLLRHLAKSSVLSIVYRTSTIYHELRQPHLEWWLVL